MFRLFPLGYVRLTHLVVFTTALCILMAILWTNEKSRIFRSKSQSRAMSERLAQNSQLFVPRDTGRSKSPLVDFDTRFTNPCFLAPYDETISDVEYFRNNKLLTIISEKYMKDYASNLTRVTLAAGSRGAGDDMQQLHCLPYYYLLGSAKSGTTDLQARMGCHPHVLRAVRKEPMWLNRYRFEGHTIEEYTNIFDTAARTIGLKYQSNYFYWNLGRRIPHVVGDHSSMTLSARIFTSDREYSRIILTKHKSSGDKFIQC